MKDWKTTLSNWHSLPVLHEDSLILTLIVLEDSVTEKAFS